MWLKVSVHCNYEGWGMLGSCIQLKLVLLILSLKRSGCASWLSKCPLHCTLMGKRNNNEVYKVMFCLSVPPPGDLSPRYCPRRARLVWLVSGGLISAQPPRQVHTSGHYPHYPQSTHHFHYLYYSPILHPPATLNTLPEAAHYYHLMPYYWLSTYLQYLIQN